MSSSRSWPSTRALNTHIFSLLLAPCGHPRHPETSAASRLTRPYSGGPLARGARLLSPTSPGPGGWPPREVPASLALLPRAREAGPHARCRPTWPYSREAGSAATQRGAGLLGSTPAALQSKLLSYSLLLPAARGGVRAGPSARLAPLLAPSSPARRSGLATPPGKAPRFSVLHDPPRGRAEKGRLGWHTRTLFFF